MTKSDSSVSGNVTEGRWCCELDRVLIGAIAQVTEGLCGEFVASRGVLRLDSSGGRPAAAFPFCTRISDCRIWKRQTNVTVTMFWFGVVTAASSMRCRCGGTVFHRRLRQVDPVEPNLCRTRESNRWRDCRENGG